MEKEEKEAKKGLFKITKVKVAIGAVFTAAVIAAGSFFGVPNQVKDLFGGNPDTEFDKTMGDGSKENGKTEEDGVQPTPAPTPEEPAPTATPEEPEEEPELTPDDEGYYFDEEDPKDTLGDGEETNTNTNEANNGQISQTPAVNDDFADLVIPNINAYKGKGNSIIDALKLCGYPSDRAYRARLAAFFGIEDYQYLGYQNLQLMECLYQYYAYLDNGQDPNANTNTNPGNGNTDSKTESDNQQHTCDFGEWISLNDEKEIRKCSCGKIEERNHNYGPWIDLGNGKEVRFCKTCGHVHERNKHQEQECDHKLGSWKDNGNGTCSRSCACGQEKETKAHVKGELVSSRKYVNNKNEYIEEFTYKCANCGTKYTTSVKLGNVIVKEIPGDDTNHKLVCIINGEEVEVGSAAHSYDSNGKCSACGHERIKEQECDHKLGSWKDNGDGTCSRECSCGQNKETKAHVKGELVSSRKYINDNNEYIEESTYKCANCGTEYTTSVKLGDVVVKEIPGDDENHKLVCIIDGVEVDVGTEAHTLGEPTVTYKDNGDGTHTKTTTYHCSACNKDIVKVETLTHKAGDLIPVDENYHKVACEDCNADVQNNLPHDYTEHEVLDDTHIKHTCACGHYYIEELEHQHIFGGEHEVDNPNPSAGDYCYKVVRSCNDLDCSEELVVETFGHNWDEDGCCTRCFTDNLSTTNEFDHDVAEDDDFDYEVSEDDDFDLQEEDIPDTAFLNLSKADIEYMADMAIARLELENALNEELEAKGLTLTYKE